MSAINTGYYIGPRPKQKLPYSEKLKNEKEWFKQCIDYYGGLDHTDNTVGKDKQKKRYDYYNSKFNIEDFDKTLNPLNSRKVEYKQWSADLRPFNIMRPIIDRISSEYRKRPFGFFIDVNNPDSVSVEDIAKKKAFTEMARQQFINIINGLSGNEEISGLPTQEVETPQMIIERFAELRDQRAIEGQYALELIMQDTYAQQKWNDLMLDWIIAGEVITHKGVEREEIIYDTYSSYDCSWDSTEQYIEDGEYCWSRIDKPLTWIVDKFYEDLTEEEIDLLEKGTQYGYNPRGAYPTNNGEIEVLHATWRTYTKVGIMSYIDPMTGELSELEVPEDYTPDKDEKVEWFWVNEVCEGYRIDGRIYTRMRTIPYQRDRVNDRSSRKLPYNGRIYSGDFNNKVSVASLAMPYQMLYLVIIRQLELVLSKNKSKVLLLDKNVIPNGDGWDEEKFLYYGQALGYLFINRNQIGVDKGYNQYNVLDMSTLGEVSNLIELAEWCQRELKEHFGITPGREGQHASKMGTGAAQMDLFQSAVVTEEIYARFDDFIEREMQGLLDLSKFAWRNGKKARFVGSDMRHKILDIDPANYSSADFGVRANVNARDLDVIKRMQQSTHAFAQNGASPLTILEVLDAQQPSRLKEAMSKMEAKQQQAIEQNQEHERKMLEQNIQAAQQAEQIKHQQEIEKINIEYDRKERIEALKTSIVPIAPEIKETPDHFYEQISNDNNNANSDRISKENIEREKLATAREIKAADLADRQAERLNKERIEKLKLKNPVSGEKIK